MIRTQLGLLSETRERENFGRPTFSPFPASFQAAINLHALAILAGSADSYLPSASGEIPAASRTHIGNGGPL